MMTAPLKVRDSAAGAAGWALRFIDRVCAVGYVGFSLWVVRDLYLSAESHGWVLLVLVVPVILATAFLLPSVLGRADALLQMPRPATWRTGVRRIDQPKPSGAARTGRFGSRRRMLQRNS